MSAYKEDYAAQLEKRRIPRFPVQLPAQLGSGDDTSSICTDLSSEGLSVETALDLHLGQRLTVSVLVSSHERPLKMLGQVVWKQETSIVDAKQNLINEIGIRFIKAPNNPWKLPSDSNYDENDEFENTAFPQTRGYV